MVGSSLAIAFSLKFLLVGISSFIASSYSLFNSTAGTQHAVFLPVAQAEIFDRGAESNFQYRTGTLKNFKMINLGSFLGKPVRIPLESVNPQGIPGGDRDYLIVYPPRILNANTSIPLRAIYFSSGKTIDPKSAEHIRNVEKYINSIGEKNATMLAIIKNLLESDLKISLKDNQSLFSLLATYLPAGALAEAGQLPLTYYHLPIAQAEESTDPWSQYWAEREVASQADQQTETENTVTDTENQNDNQDTVLDTSDPETKQLLTLILMLLILNQSMAESLNKDKENCLAINGEWINNECVSEEKNACEDNGGNYRLFANQCLADKQECDNDDLQCDEDQSNSNDNEDSSVYGCACKSGTCLNDEGVCMDKDNGKKKRCEDSGGRWRSFFSQEELCLQRCDADETECGGTWNDNSSDWWAESGNDNRNELMGCDCDPDCLAPSGTCIEKDKTKDDDDKDGVPNDKDRCPGTPQGEGVNNVEGSQDQGCSCSQLQSMGRLRQNQQQCPPDGCEFGSNYFVTYDRSGTNNSNQTCQNGVIQQQQQQQQYGQYSQYGSGSSTCPVISRVPNEQCNNNNNRNNNDNLRDMLQKMLDDKNKNDNQKKNNDNKKDDKDKGQQQQQSSNNGGQQQPQQQPPQSPQQNQNQNGNTNDDKVKPKKEGNGSDPQGVGKYNKDRNGTVEYPYLLHVSQFRKLCGENTYVLDNARPGVGNFIDKNEAAANNPSNKPASRPPSSLPGAAPTSGLQGVLSVASAANVCPPGQTSCPGTAPAPGPTAQIPQQLRNEYEKLKKETDWNKVSQRARNEIDKIVKSGKMDQSTLDQVKKLIGQGKEELTKPAEPGSLIKKDGVKSMKDELLNNMTHFKVPSCKELAACDCCVCSCCDKEDSKCGWTIGEKCNKDGDKGKCEGDKCSKAPASCKEEDPAKSIKFVWGDKFNECGKEGNKEKTCQEKCEKYDKPVHGEGACRYDCEGSAKGCEEGSDQCKIIILAPDGAKVPHSDASSSSETQLKETHGTIEFVNRPEGSIVANNYASKSESWMGDSRIKDNQKEAKCCKCDKRKDHKLPAAPSNGNKPDSQNSNSYQNTDPWPTDSDLEQINNQINRANVPPINPDQNTQFPATLPDSAKPTPASPDSRATGEDWGNPSAYPGGNFSPPQPAEQAAPAPAVTPPVVPAASPSAATAYPLPTLWSNIWTTVRPFFQTVWNNFWGNLGKE